MCTSGTPVSPDMARRFERYVAIGDSTTEGLDDPDGNGGYRGWANRLAERIATQQGSVLYANLAIRGRTTRQILDEQLERAVAMRPDLSTVVSGTNDLIHGRFDPASVEKDVETMQRALIDVGATVLSFTLPDLAPVMPLARFLTARTMVLNDVLRRASERSGAILVDLAAHPVGSDRRLWSDDRLHANAHGHERIAHALAHAAGLPDADDSWTQPLDPDAPRSLRAKLAAEVAWGRDYLWPWLVRQARRRSSGDGRVEKRPQLTPFSVSDAKR